MINKVATKMIHYYNGDPKRIQHFLKVHSFSKLIGESEGLSQAQMYVLEISSLVHDIGIRVSEQKYGSCTGKQQEQEGPAEARKLLEGLQVESDVIEKVCYLVAHHHTYKDIKLPEYQILVEADFLVNLYEDSSSENSVKNAMTKIFKTKTGIELCKTMFLV